MRSCRIVVAAFAAALCVATTAEAKTYMVGVENIDYFPQYRGSTTQYEGFARELFDAFAANTNSH